MLENTPEFWRSSWQRHMDTYFSALPRTGIFIKRILGKKIKSVLEVACGSSRDSRFLAKKKFSVTASDFDCITLDFLREKKNPENVNYIIADATELPFVPKKFDLVFHNGFFIYFSENTKIIQFLKEQERVAKKFVLVIVHNNQNTRLKNQFLKLAKNDPLYDIRFFTCEELKMIVDSAEIGYKKISFLKFGGPGDIFYNKVILRIIPNIFYPVRELVVPFFYHYQTWEQTERIACLIELDT